MHEVVAASGLGMRFGAHEALREVAFAIEGPQVVCILGPNGAGKTTLLELLQGLRTPTSGAIRLFGAALERKRYPRQRIGVVMQREFVLEGVTVGEYAELFAAIYGVKDGRAKVVAQARLVGREAHPVARLSGGEAQRLFIAASSVHGPELLFLDEPTSHLDPESKRELGALIRELGRTCTVLMTTHDLREADGVCDHALFLVQGQVKAQGPRQALLDAVPEAQRATGGLEDAFFFFCAQRITATGALG